MTQVLINGNTYSDDGSTSNDMLGKGYASHFFPMIADTMARVEDAETAATDAANYAASLHGTSSTSLTVSIAVKTLTTQTDRAFADGQYVQLISSANPGVSMTGVVNSYNSGTGVLELDVTAKTGSGSAADWNIVYSGAPGAAGTTGGAYESKTANCTVQATDTNKVFGCTGTFTLSFSDAATLGAEFVVWVQNNGSGVVTLAPYSAQTIDGSATIDIHPAHTLRILSDGANLVTSFLAPRQMLKLPALSSATAGLTPVSSMERMENGIYDTGLSASYQVLLDYCASSALYIAKSSGSSANVATSPDGVTWTLRTMPASASWSYSAVNGGNVMAIASGATNVALSTDGGVTWSAATALPAACFAIGYIGGLWVAMRGGSTSYYTSPDGVTWTTRTGPASIGGSAGLYQVGSVLMFTPVSGVSGTYYTTPDGVAWTTRSFPASVSTEYRVKQYDGSFTVGNVEACDTQHSTTNGVDWTSVVGVVTGAVLVKRPGGVLFSVANDTNTYAYTLGAVAEQPGTRLTIKGANVAYAVITSDAMIIPGTSPYGKVAVITDGPLCLYVK